MTPRLEGFERLEEIGRGGFGVVYKAWQPEFARNVALKVLPPDRGDADTSLRVEREAIAMGSLSGHPNIVAIHAAGVTENGEPFFVMPFLAGGSLQDRIATTGALSWQLATAIGVKIAGALHTAHASGVLHRDVKPDNILFSEFGEPQLADFGIARLAGATQTVGGAVATTVLFAAPEVLSGQRPTAASDVYSLASTVYAAVSGQAPFASGGEVPLAGTIARIATEAPSSPARDTPDALWAVLERALAKDPRDRPASAAAFGGALQRAQRLEGASVTPMTVPPGSAPDYEVTILVEADPSEGPSSSGGTAGTVVLQPTRQVRPVPTSDNASQPPPSRNRTRWALVGVLLVGVIGLGVLAALAASGNDDTAPTDTEIPSTTATAPTATAGPLATTPTTGVTAERPSQGVALFEDAIDALTPFSNDLAVYAVSGTETIDSPENEAALLGSWYSLSDWCQAEGHGRVGVCYDLAAEFLLDRFGRDPRTINDESWGAPGAIGGVIDTGYDITQQYLGLPAIEPPTYLVTSSEDRPGQFVLCEPSCTAVMD